MKCIICGSRDINNYQFVEKIIDGCPWKSEITEVVSGTCRGPDLFGEQWAKKHNLPVKRFEPDWSLGKKGGVLRNQDMADYADAAIIISKNSSAGTADMKARAEKKGLKIHYVEVRDKETFSLSQLQELASQTKDMDMIGGDLWRRILSQYLKQLQEYQIVIRDCRVMMEALQSCDIDYCGPNESKCQVYDYKLVEKAINTPTAKLLQSLNANNQ